MNQKSIHIFKKPKNINYYKKISLIILLFLIFIIIYIVENINHTSNMLKLSVDIKDYNYDNGIMKDLNKNSLYKNLIQKISIISHEKKKKSRKNKNIIHISMSINNIYIYQLLVSIESALINCNKNRTILIYHLMCSYDLTKDNLLKIKSFMKRYSSNLEIIFYNMSDLFIDYEKKSLNYQFKK